MLQEINEQNFCVAAAPKRTQNLIAGVRRLQQSSKLSGKAQPGGASMGTVQSSTVEAQVGCLQEEHCQATVSLGSRLGSSAIFLEAAFSSEGSTTRVPRPGEPAQPHPVFFVNACT